MIGRLAVVQFFSTRTEEVAREALAPSLDLYGSDPRVYFLKVERTMNPGALDKYGIDILPTVVIFKSGAAVATLVGNDSARLQIEIEREQKECELNPRKFVSPFSRKAFQPVVSQSTCSGVLAAKTSSRGDTGSAAGSKAPARGDSQQQEAMNADDSAPASGAGAGQVDGEMVEPPVDEGLLRQLAGGAASSSEGGPAQSGAQGEGQGQLGMMGEDDGEEGGEGKQQDGGEGEDGGLGISRNRAVRALFLGRCRTVEEAIEWLEEHQDDDMGADEPLLVSEAAAAVARLSLESGVTGAVAGGDHGEGGGAGGHASADGELGTKRKLTKAELEERIRKRRREKAEAERQMSKERERKRREEGRKLAQVATQMEEQRRRRDREEREREKRARKEERVRLRKQMLRDRAERLAAQGDAEGAKKLLEEVAALGVDALAAGRGKPVGQRMDEAVKSLSQYRAGAEGLRSLKMLRLIVDNAVSKGLPDSGAASGAAGGGEHLKYRKVNTKSKAFESRVQGFKGGMSLLLAAGFARVEGDFDRLECNPEDPATLENLRSARDKLDAAIAELS